MPNKKLSVGLTVVLAIITVAPFVTGTRAVAQETVLHSFSPNNPKFGDLPLAGLIFDAAGNLYGTTASSGANLGGTAFELTPASGGGWTERVLYNFENGANSAAGLVFDAAGNLYGTTSRGGTTKGGTVFEITP